MIPYMILAIEDEDDREFMTWLYIQYRNLLYSEILKLVNDPWNAEDILQTVIEKLIDRVSLLKTLDRHGLVNYIITAAKHTAYNYCRDAKPIIFFGEDQDMLAASSPSLDDSMIKEENLACLAQVWETLDEKTQYLLSARYVLGKSGKEIARDLDMPPDNVRMALVRAKRKAKQAMDAWQRNTSQ